MKQLSILLEDIKIQRKAYIKSLLALWASHILYIKYINMRKRIEK